MEGREADLAKEMSSVPTERDAITSIVPGFVSLRGEHAPLSSLSRPLAAAALLEVQSTAYVKTSLSSPFHHHLAFPENPMASVVEFRIDGKITQLGGHPVDILSE